MEESVDNNEKRADLLELSILCLVSVGELLVASPLVVIEVGVGGTRVVVAMGNGLEGTGIGDFLLPACFLRFFKLGNLLSLADRLFPLLPLSGVARGGSAGTGGTSPSVYPGLRGPKCGEWTVPNVDTGEKYPVTVDVGEKYESEPEPEPLGLSSSSASTAAGVRSASWSCATVLSSSIGVDASPLLEAQEDSEVSESLLPESLFIMYIEISLPSAPNVLYTEDLLPSSDVKDKGEAGGTGKRANETVDAVAVGVGGR